MSLKGVPVLVTGGTGFIGTHLVNSLLKEGAEVSIISRKKTAGKNVNTLTGDLTDKKFIEKAVKEINPKKIFHLAAFVNPSRDLELLNDVFKTNFYGTVNLLNSLKNMDYDSFVLVSTAEVYGNNKTPFKEDMKLDPLSPYSLSKASAEMFCNMCSKAHNYPITTLRLFLVYGPGQKPDRFIPQLITTLLSRKQFKMTKGGQKRDFILVDDAVEALIRASVTKNANGETINICNGKQYTIKEIADNVANILNAKNLISDELPYRENEQWEYYGDLAKARKLLNWSPKTSLNDGLKKTIAYYSKFV